MGSHVDHTTIIFPHFLSLGFDPILFYFFVKKGSDPILVGRHFDRR